MRVRLCLTLQYWKSLRTIGEKNKNSSYFINKLCQRWIQGAMQQQVPQIGDLKIDTHEHFTSGAGNLLNDHQWFIQGVVCQELCLFQNYRTKKKLKKKAQRAFFKQNVQQRCKCQYYFPNFILYIDSSDNFNPKNQRWSRFIRKCIAWNCADRNFWTFNIKHILNFKSKLLMMVVLYVPLKIYRTEWTEIL